jgi:hypothetical protein
MENFSVILGFLRSKPNASVEEVVKALKVDHKEVKMVRQIMAFSVECARFAKVWNDVRTYPANFTLKRAFDQKMPAIFAMRDKYKKFRKNHPEFSLPLLIERRSTTGGLVPVPQEILMQLDEYRADTDLQGVKGVVVTGAQYGADLNSFFWKSLNVYALHRGLRLLVLPIKYGPVNAREGRLTNLFPDELKGKMVFDDMVLCRGELMLNTTRMRPTLERFLTNRVCEMGGMMSQIIAAPKLELEYRPRVGRHQPKAIMTTGAVTVPNYHVDNLGQQDRTGEVAAEEHNYAAIVVEFQGDMFHFRQLHANKKGDFYDIAPLKGGAEFFSVDGVQHKPEGVAAIVCGDWHTGKTDPDVRKGTFGKKGSMVAKLKPKSVVLHDFIDGDATNPHEADQASRRAHKGPLQWDSVLDELEGAKKELEWMKKHTDAQLYVVASNHNEFLGKWVDSMEWVKDNRNLAIGNELFYMTVQDLLKRKPKKVFAGGTDPIVLWLRSNCPGIIALERQDPLLLPKGVKNPILCSMHGDVGLRGAKTRGNTEFRGLNQRVILGHNHTATISGPVWRVGTSTPRTQFYVSNPATNWTNSHAVIFENGQRQLVNFIKEGKWHG